MPFPAGNTTVNYPIIIMEDNVYEGTESFKAVLTLPSPSNGLTLGNEIMATVNIVDNEGKQMCI